MVQVEVTSDDRPTKNVRRVSTGKLIGKEGNSKKFKIYSRADKGPNMGTNLKKATSLAIKNFCRLGEHSDM